MNKEVTLKKNYKQSVKKGRTVYVDGENIEKAIRKFRRNIV
jgi:hypothetical protein